VLFRSVDTRDVSDGLSPAAKISTDLSTENHAQYADIVDIGDKGDNIQASQETENSNSDCKTVKLSEINNDMKFGQECPASSNGI